MFTSDVIALLVLAFVPLAIAVFLLAYGVYGVITENDISLCVIMSCVFIFFLGLSAIIFSKTYEEYNNAIPQNYVKILRQKISDAEKEYQKYLIDHPELEIKKK